MEARGKASGDRISGFWLREILEHVCGVGFIWRGLDLRRSGIDVTGLLEFVDLGQALCHGGCEMPWSLDPAEKHA